MKVLYHYPSPETTNAGRTIYYGYKNAFVDKGHVFETFSNNLSFKRVISDFQPDIFITNLHRWCLKYIDIELLKSFRKGGLKVFMEISAWELPKNMLYLGEAPPHKYDLYIRRLIEDNIADIYFCCLEPWDKRVINFEKDTGIPYNCIPLAADKTYTKNYDYSSQYHHDVVFLGSYHPAKKAYIDKYIRPLASQYKIALIGQNWDAVERIRSLIQKVGQYFNIPYIKALNKAKYKLEEEAYFYRFSSISINIHTAHQILFGGDVNERFFKIPAYGGFQISDNVACISNYLTPGKEVIVVKDPDEWHDVITYYLERPALRSTMILEAQKKILSQHTYHNRVDQMVKLYQSSLN